MKKSTLALLALASSLLASGAIAQQALPPAAPGDAPQMGMGGFEGGDITRDQFMARAAQRFDDMDTNHDGKISPEERKAAREHMRERMQSRRGGGGDEFGGPVGGIDDNAPVKQ